MADRAFAWLVHKLQQRQPTYRAQLQAVKNAAYAWRQALYFLSVCPPNAHAEALARLRDQVQAAGAGLQARSGPAVDGLAYVIAGGAFDATGLAPDPGGGRRFLGWTVGPHWILTADASSNALGRPAST